jgi:uncharacterized membrane protein (DUF373 family)
MATPSRRRLSGERDSLAMGFDRVEEAIMATENLDSTAPRPISNWLFLRVEHALYLALGLLLAATGLLALGGAAATLWNGLGAWTAPETVFIVIDRLLFVLMLIEILHTVRVSVRSGSLSCEPFLVVGLIASIRRILVITLESSQAAKHWSDEVEQLFRASMIELAVLGALIAVMVASIFLLRRTGVDTGGSFLLRSRSAV